MYLNFGVVCHFKVAVYDCGCDNNIKKLQQNCKHLVQHIFLNFSSTHFTLFTATVTSLKHSVSYAVTGHWPCSRFQNKL